MSKEKNIENIGEVQERAAEQTAQEVQSFTVDMVYGGYTFVGHAAGQFETQRGEMRPYFNMYVLSPVSSFVSEDYEAWGMKADKKKCIGPEVWEGLSPGDKVKLFFDDKQRVVMAALDS